MTRIRNRRKTFTAAICAHLDESRVDRIKQRAARDGISFERELYRLIFQREALR